MNLNQLLAKTGQFPGIGIKLVPLQQTLYSYGGNYQSISSFLEYKFRSSIVNPVADFSFTFAMPNYTKPFTDFIHEGDEVILFIKVQGQEFTLCTGLIDTIETQVSSAGEQVTVMGRDLLGQWDDQSIFTPDGNLQVLSASMSPTTLYDNLSQHTRTPAVRLQGIPSVAYPIGFSPQESKLQVVTRYLEPYNALVWSDPDGTVVFGKPNMAFAPAGTTTASAPGASASSASPLNVISGTLMVNKTNGVANCLSMRSTRSSATIPNYVTGIFSGQTIAANQVTKQQGLANPQPGPARLASLGHYLSRVIVTSDPGGSLPQAMNFVSSLIFNGSNPLNRCRAYAAREMARENMRELIVQAVVPGHLNEQGNAYQKDQLYRVNFDRDGIDLVMYLYECEYSLDEKEGPKTLLMLCNLNSIVAGNNFQ